MVEALFMGDEASVDEQQTGSKSFYSFTLINFPKCRDECISTATIIDARCFFGVCLG